MSFENNENEIMQNIRSDNFYTRLGVLKNASASEIKEAYLKLAVIYHPDKGGDEDDFKNLREAYEAVSVSNTTEESEPEDLAGNKTSVKKKPGDNFDDVIQEGKAKLAAMLARMKAEHAQEDKENGTSK
jgi:DnaJ family protein A protein 2